MLNFSRKYPSRIFNVDNIALENTISVKKYANVNSATLSWKLIISMIVKPFSVTFAPILYQLKYLSFKTSY